MSRRLIVSVLFAGVLCGCASLAPMGVADEASADGLTCADASHFATFADGARARSLAHEGVAAQLDVLHSEMLNAGYRRLRIEFRPAQCTPFTLFGAETYCKVAGSVCGRHL